MREIKFRAWHKEWEGMVYSDKVDCFEKREYYPFVFAIGFSHYPQDDGWEIMQFTGLLDKNGKDIYEGDMCKWPSGNVSKIEWDNERACFTAHWRKGGGGGRSGIVSKCIEIIGNIYQNPKLIKS